MQAVKIIECSRDAMQGIKEIIPTEAKVSYINSLLKCGFDTLDFGSFVSPKAIPQMADTKEVLSQLDLSLTKTKLLAIIANLRGAKDAVNFSEIYYLGFPFSISETFQQRNTNSSIEDSFKNLAEIQNLCLKNDKKLVSYLSMGFGNPYGDLYNKEVVIKWSEKLHHELGIEIIALSDTVGTSTPDLVTELFSFLIPSLPKVEFGAHLHTTFDQANKLIDAAYMAGCKRFDGAIKGFGGCPMAKNDLTGNMPTETIINYFNNKGIETGINQEVFQASFEMSTSVFNLNN
jgi:hydroxymethylglutaryl-CoA lyase